VSIGLAVSIPTRPRHLGAPSSQIWCSQETPPQKTRQHTRDTLTWVPYFFGPMGASSYPSDFSSDISSDFASDFSSDFPSDFFPVSSSNVQSECKTGVIQFFIRFFIRFLCMAFISKISNEIDATKNWIENWMGNWMTHWNAHLDEHFVTHWSIHCRTHWRTHWYNVREGPQGDSRPLCRSIDLCTFCIYLIMMRYTYEFVGFRIFVQWLIILSSHDLQNPEIPWLSPDICGLLGWGGVLAVVGRVMHAPAWSVDTGGEGGTSIRPFIDHSASRRLGPRQLADRAAPIGSAPFQFLLN